MRACTSFLKPATRGEIELFSSTLEKNIQKKCGFLLAEVQTKWKTFFSHTAGVLVQVYGGGGGEEFRSRGLYKVQFVLWLLLLPYTHPLTREEFQESAQVTV